MYTQKHLGGKVNNESIFRLVYNFMAHERSNKRQEEETGEE